MTTDAILVVEDDEDLLDLMTMMLEAGGHHVAGARNGAEALEHIRAAGVPKLILLDMNMPVMNGYEFARRFRETYDRRAPIIVVTANPSARQAAAAIQADGWLGKPFQQKDLLQKVDEQTRPT